MLARVCRAAYHHLTLSTVRIERRVPDLCAVCVAGNRIWGADVDGISVRACAEGDPTSWYDLDGGESGSCLLTTAHPGSFTGMVTLGDLPVCFKSRLILRVRGTRPDNYTLAAQELPGLASDSPRGIALLDGTVYYASADGILSWDGGACAHPVSGALGAAPCAVRSASAGGLCWFSAEIHAARRMYVYDPAHRAWNSLSYAPETVFAFGGALYFVTCDGTSRELWRIGRGDDDGLGDGDTPAAPEWSFCCEGIVPNGDHGCFPASIAVDAESDGSGTVEISFSWDGDSRRVTGLCFSGRVRREIALPQRYAGTVGVSMSGRGRFILRSLEIRASSVRR